MMSRLPKLTLVLSLSILLMFTGLASSKETISFMSLDVVNFRPMLEQFIAEFEAENPDIDIQPIWSSSLGEQALAAMQSGNAPDIIFIWSGFAIPQIHRNQFAEVPKPFLEKLEGVVYPESLVPLMARGKLYGVPYNFYPSFGTVMYNVDLWEEAGLEPGSATTWDEFMQLCQKVTKFDATGNMVQAGFSAERDSEDYFSAWLLQLGGKPFNEDGSAAFDNELGREAVKLYSDIYLKWKVDSPEFGLTADEFKKGRVASTVMGPWYGSIVSKDTPDLNYAYIKQPGIEGTNTPPYWPLREVWTHLVSKQAGSRDAVWQFLDFLLEPDRAARWSGFSGEISAVMAAMDYPEVQTSPYLAPFMDATPYGVAENITQYYSEDVVSALQTMLQSVIFGQAGIDEAVTRAAREVDRVNQRLAR